MHYFIRVNGRTVHDDPQNEDCFVAREPNEFKRSGYSNYLGYCLENNIVRIGWPDVGDLRTMDGRDARSNCYDLNTEKPYVKEYLVKFSQIPIGSTILVPDKDKPGDLYLGDVYKTYWYDPEDIYECAHRLGVNWDRDRNYAPIKYTNEQLGINISGGWWRRAFFEITNPDVINSVETERKKGFSNSLH